MQPAHYYLMVYTVFSLSSSSSFSLVERHTTHWHMSRCYELDSHSFDGSISMFLRWPLCMWHVTAKHFIMLLFGWLSEPKRIDWLTTNFFSRQNNQLNISIKAMNEKPFDEATVSFALELYHRHPEWANQRIRSCQCLRARYWLY